MEFFDKVKAPTLGVLDVDDDTGIKRQVAEKKIIPIIEYYQRSQSII